MDTPPPTTPLLLCEVVRTQLVPHLVDLDSFLNLSETCHHYHKALAIQFPPHLSRDVWKRQGPRQIIRKGGEVMLTEDQFSILCEMAKDLFTAEPNNLNINGPVTVVGNVHGQWHDLIHMFSLHAPIPETQYLFLGNYVDRGLYSTKTIVYLFALKICHPNHVFLLRGNHEEKQINQVYGFKDELERVFGEEAHERPFTVINEAFEYLPLTAVINNNIFCVHNGLSPDLHSIEDINKLERHVRPQDFEGPVFDLLWSQPEDQIGWGRSPRSSGWLFGRDILEQWNETNGFKCTIRSGQLKEHGFEWQWDKSICTFLSVPNYCYRCGNLAAVLDVSASSEVKEIVFEHTPIPDEEDPRKKSSDTPL